VGLIREGKTEGRDIEEIIGGNVKGHEKEKSGMGDRTIQFVNGGTDTF